MSAKFHVADTRPRPTRRPVTAHHRPPGRLAVEPAALDAATVQRLQATAGNQAVAELVGGSVAVQRCGGERHEGCVDCA